MIKKKLHKLEAIRGIASFYVILHHTYHIFLPNSPLSFLFEFGQEAVILFFILSGFVIEYSFSQTSDKSFKTYFFKRFNRIYIPLIIVFTANFLLYYFEGKVLRVDYENLLGNLFMLQDNFYKPNIFCLPFLGNSPLWSLSYEWWFYMIFYFLYIFLRKKAFNIIYFIGTIATITYLFYPFWLNRIFMYMIIWNIGADLARIYIKHKVFKLKLIKGQIFILSINVILLAFNFFINKDNVHALLHFKSTQTIGRAMSPFLELRHFVFAILALVLGVLWYKLKWFGFSNTVGLFEKFAPISYCVYISHWFLISHATYLSFVNNIFVRYILYFFVCIIFSYVVEKIIYKKINNIVVKMLKKKLLST